MSQFNVEILKTSNPEIVKFCAATFLTESSSHEYHNVDEAKDSELAQQLFYLPFVKTVYISQNFIALEKYPIVEWHDVEEEVAHSISQYLRSGKPVIGKTQEEKKMPVTVYAESTPNPTAMKFVANKKLVPDTQEFKNREEGFTSPLARALFDFPFVKEIFIKNNYISITKYEGFDWQDITMELREFIREFLHSENSVLGGGGDEVSLFPEAEESPLAEMSVKNHSPIEKEIVAILKEYVEPAVASDGGHIVLHSFDPSSKTVKVILQGACSGCPSSTATLKNGIEAILKELLPKKIGNVVAING